MNNDSFYKSLSIKNLEEFAVKTFGVNPPSDLVEILSLLKQNQSVLEIGAGTGRIGIELIKKGFRYFGVDKQRKYLNVFKKRLKKENINISNSTLLPIAFEELNKDLKFDIIIFSWTVIWDFSKQEQFKALERAYFHLNKKGKCLLDNPSKRQEYNKYGSYAPTPFYYDEWKQDLTNLGFVHSSKIYTTKTGVERELTILKKK